MKFIPRPLLALLLAAALPAAWADIAVIQGGATSQQVQVRAIVQSTGAPDTALAYNTSGLTCNYARPGAASTSITLATQTVTGAYSSGGFVHVQNGWYRLDLPDAAIAASVPSVLVTCAATGDTFVDGRVTLTAVNLQDSVRGGMTALPNAAAEASGGLYTRGTGAGQIAQTINGAVDVNATRVGSQTASAAGTVTFPGTIASTTNITAGTITTATTATNVTTVSSGAISEASYATTAGSFKPLGILDQGTAQAATATTVQLRSAAAFGDDTILGATVMACGSTQGYCQSGVVTDYVSSTDTATVPTWGVTPSGTVTYYVFGTAPASGGSGATAAEVWAYGTRTLTALDEDTTTIDLNASYVGGVTVFDEDLTTIDINATTIGTTTTATNLTNAPTSGDFTATMKTSIGTAVAASAVASVTGNVGGNVTGSVGTVNALAANVITAAATAADFTTEIQSGLATASALTGVGDDVTDVKAKTDSLTFTVAGEVDSNTQSMNGAAVLGDGTTGDKWRGE